MGWKDWKNWMRGAFIGGIVGVLYNALLIIFLITHTGGLFLESGFKPIYSISNYWCNTFVFPLCRGNDCGCGISVPQLISIALLMVLGAFIGWIYGRIVNTDKENKGPQDV